MELREQKADRLEKYLREQINPEIKFETLPANIQEYIRNSCSFWILQAQCDLLSEIMTGNPASDYVPELYDLKRKRAKDESTLLKKIRQIVEYPDPHAEQNKEKLYKIKHLLEEKKE